jgi:protein-S-isoprenylcysteine O-methyltransferase Ste14
MARKLRVQYPGLGFAKGGVLAALLVIVPQALAVLLGIWARISFGRRSFHVAANPTAGGLVTTGPYRFIRHPIYVAVSLLTVPGALAHWSGKAVGFAGLVLAGVLVRVLCQEKLLVDRYPDYREYAAKTWRMVPFLF